MEKCDNEINALGRLLSEEEWKEIMAVVHEFDNPNEAESLNSEEIIELSFSSNHSSISEIPEDMIKAVVNRIRSYSAKEVMRLNLELENKTFDLACAKLRENNLEKELKRKEEKFSKKLKNKDQKLQRKKEKFKNKLEEKEQELQLLKEHIQKLRSITKVNLPKFNEERRKLEEKGEVENRKTLGKRSSTISNESLEIPPAKKSKRAEPSQAEILLKNSSILSLKNSDSSKHAKRTKAVTVTHKVSRKK